MIEISIKQYIYCQGPSQEAAFFFRFETRSATTGSKLGKRHCGHHCASITIIESEGGMGGTCRTFMADPLGALPPGLGNAIQSQLAALFSPIVGFNNFFENNWVNFNPIAAAPVAHELLVYFMPSGKSIVKNAPNVRGPIDLSADGNTAYGAGASEVYVKYSDAVLLGEAGVS